MLERPRRFPPRIVDAAVVAGVAIVGLFGLVGPVLFSGADPGRITFAAVTVVVACAAPLWWRRTQPLPVLTATLVVVLVAQALADPNAPSLVGVPAAAYAVGVYAPRRRAWLGLAIVAAATAVDVAIVELTHAAGEPSRILMGPFGAFTIAAWLLGRYVAVRRAYLDTLVAYSRQLEKDRDEQARQAVRAERRRIARDLHDQVAHHLGVVSLQTGAARRWLERDAGRAAVALASAQEAARAALETMPAILHALRADDATDELEPQARLDGLADLVRRLSSDEVTVDLRIDGSRRPLPSALEVTGYRLIQEALTNVVKHAGPASVIVAVRYGADHLDIEVTDDGYGMAATSTVTPSAKGSRLGLVGMQERVELLGGTFTAGPRSGGGFRVHATLPLTGGSR